MKRKTTVLLVALVLVLTTVLFAGCGQKAEPAETTAAQAVAETTAAAAETTAAPDAVTTASLVNEEGALLKGLGKDGTWIVAILKDMTVGSEITVEGEFHNKGDSAQPLYRKLGLYAQDADHKVTANYTLTAPKMTVKSENFKIQSGTFVGDIYVEAKGFTLTASKIEGNIYFASEELKSTFKQEKEATVSGAIEVKK